MKRKEIGESSTRSQGGPQARAPREVPAVPERVDRRVAEPDDGHGRAPRVLRHAERSRCVPVSPPAPGQPPPRPARSPPSPPRPAESCLYWGGKMRNMDIFLKKGCSFMFDLYNFQA